VLFAGMVAAAPAAAKQNPQEQQLLSPMTNSPQTKTSLSQAYAGAFLIGAAIPGAQLNTAERDLLCRQFHAVTPENCMKPQPLHPEEKRYDFAAADALVKLARAHGLIVNGHTLVWHHQCPAWFFRDGDKPAPRRLVLRRLQAHVTTVAKHFAGQVASWDVVNEALADETDGYLRPSQWVTSIGDDFIAQAFLAARRADPRAELYYNDYGIEQPVKREKALRLIRDLQRQKVPLQGIGIQGHWELDKVPYQDIEDAILAFHNEGLAVAITELDLDVVPRAVAGADAARQESATADPYAGGLPPEIQQRLADQYARLFALFYKHRDKISRVTFWGLHDGRTWLNHWPSKRTNHPLLWDRQLQPKPALAAVLAVPGQQP